jgi:DNA-binding CsgD family transcriptional regulator/tetratricopeptide (TPR) repeat protein
MRDEELLERAAPLEALTANLKRAARGRGSLVWVGGEAGVGKTSFVRRFCADVRASAVVLEGACDALSAPRPLGPLFDIAPQIDAELARALERGDDRPSVFAGLLERLRRARRPVVVVIEDAHWADDATLDLLRYLGRRIEDARTLLLCTYRNDEVGSRHPLRAVLGDLATARTVRRLALEPLGRESVARLAAGSGLDAGELHRATGGNPFFVTEVLASAEGGVPRTVRDVVLARASRLTPDARSVLDLAAVVGQQAEVRLLQELGADAADIEACVERGMLTSAGTRVAFRHELAREALLGALPATRRQRLHAVVLRALEARCDGGCDLATLAHHADWAGDSAAVLRYAPAAGRQARDLGAPREAYSQFARALPYAASLPPAERAELHDDFAAACATTDRLEASYRAREAAAALWRSVGRRDRAAEALAFASGALVQLGRNADADRIAATAVRELDGLPEGPALATALSSQAGLRMLNRDGAEAVQLGQRAIAVAERTGATRARITALNTVGSALLVSEAPGGREHLLRSLEQAREANDPELSVYALSNLGSGSGEVYRLGDAERALAEAETICRAHDLDRGLWYVLAWRALVYVHRGRWDAATEAAREVLDAATAAISRIMALVALGRVRVRRGDPDARPVLDEALELALRTGTLQRLAPVRAARAEAAYVAGDPEAVAVEASAAFDLAVQHRHRWFATELAYWRFQAGDTPSLPAWEPTPFALQLGGRAADAAAAWRELGCPYQEAIALAEVGDEAALRASHRIATELGAAPAASEALRRLRAMGARDLPRSPHRGTSSNPAGLTPREAEVLERMAEGLRNVEIAERHGVSVRTVDHQVSAVLEKLGARTRTEAVTEALRLGIVDAG